MVTIRVALDVSSLMPASVRVVVGVVCYGVFAVVAELVDAQR